MIGFLFPSVPLELDLPKLVLSDEAIDFCTSAMANTVGVYSSRTSVHRGDIVAGNATD